MTSERYPTVDLEAGYENVAAVCPGCTKRNVYNRVTDIGHLGLIDNHHVTCENPNCRTEFDICGDLVNAPYEMLLLDSCEFLKEKRYMQAVLSATTAYELFFAHFLRVELVYRPSRRDGDSATDAWLNENETRLREKIERLTFVPMRHRFLHAAVNSVRPATLVAAEDSIVAIPGWPEVTRTKIEQLSDEPRRTLLLRVHNATIANLRNNIVHKTAYRPSLAETQAAVHDAHETIFRLSSHFGLGTTNYHLNERLD